MQLSTQIQRFVISCSLFAAFAGVIVLQPQAQDQISTQIMQELPAVIIVEQAPVSEHGRGWRLMLPASLASRRS